MRGKIRAVTHLDVSAEDIELAIKAATTVVKSGAAKGPRVIGSDTVSRY